MRIILGAGGLLLSALLRDELDKVRFTPTTICKKKQTRNIRVYRILENISRSEKSKI